MPSRPWGSLGLRPRDPQGPGMHYFFTNNALAGILIIVLDWTSKGYSKCFKVELINPSHIFCFPVINHNHTIDTKMGTTGNYIIS